MNGITGTGLPQEPIQPPMPEQKASPMMQAIMYSKMRRQGYDFDAAIEGVFDEKMQLLQQRSDFLREKLLDSQQKVQTRGHELLEDRAAIAIFDAAHFQNENTQQALDLMQEVTTALKEQLALAESELQQKEAATARLNGELAQFRIELKGAQGKHHQLLSFFQDIAIGEKGSNSGGAGRQPTNNKINR